MESQVLAVYKIFEEIVGEPNAKTIVSYMENAQTAAIEKVIDTKIAHLATREELLAAKQELRQEIEALRTDLADFKAFMIKEMASLRAYVADTKAELMKWMLVFWVGQALAIASVLLVVLKK